jgi:hypothetical protein
MEGARIYAQNAIREKNSSLNFLRLGSRVDAVAARLESAIRMQVIVLFTTGKFCYVHHCLPHIQSIKLKLHAVDL